MGLSRGTQLAFMYVMFRPLPTLIRPWVRDAYTSRMGKNGRSIAFNEIIRLQDRYLAHMDIYVHITYSRFLFSDHISIFFKGNTWC